MTMISSNMDLPERYFDGDGRRLPGSWPPVPSWPGLEGILARTPITFVSAAQWRWREGHGVPNRRLPTTNLALYLAGEGTAWIGGAACPIATHTLIITPRGVPQRVRHAPGKPFRALSVHAQLPMFGGQADLFAVLGSPPRLELDPRRDAVLFQAMAEMARLDACRPAGWAALAQAHLVLLVHHLLSGFQSAFQPRGALPMAADAMRLEPVLQWIEQSLGDGALAVDDLARILGIGPVATRRLFHRCVGMSPNRFIQRCRIDRACRLLRVSSASIGEIARAVGCADGPVFHRLFRRWTGTTPERWRHDA